MFGKPRRKINRKRFVLSITPLLLMLVAIVLLNLFTPDATAIQPATASKTAVPPAQSAAAATIATRAPILLATILPSPTPTITPLPGVPVEASIIPIGPPDESRLPLDGRITFYWTYSEPLLPGQELVLTLQQNGTILATSSLKMPNLGSNYQISLDLKGMPAGTAVWQVHLQWQNTTEPLLVSERRSLVLEAE